LVNYQKVEIRDDGKENLEKRGNRVEKVANRGSTGVFGGQHCHTEKRDREG